MAGRMANRKGSLGPDILLTTYEMGNVDCQRLSRIKYKYLIVDEGKGR